MEDELKGLWIRYLILSANYSFQAAGNYYLHLQVRELKIRLVNLIVEGQTSKKSGVRNWIWVSWLFNPHFFLTGSVVLTRSKEPLDWGSKENGWMVFSYRTLLPYRKGFCVAVGVRPGGPVRRTKTQLLLPTWRDGQHGAEKRHQRDSPKVKIECKKRGTPVRSLHLPPDVGRWERSRFSF